MPRSRPAAASSTAYVLGELCPWLTDHRVAAGCRSGRFSINLSTGALLRRSLHRDSCEKALRDARLNPRLHRLRDPREAMPPASGRATPSASCSSARRSGLPRGDRRFHLPLRSAAAAAPACGAACSRSTPTLTVAALKDKVAQAQVAAISHGSRVLGMHCVAKRIESPTARQWLSAIGVDFAQGYLLEGPAAASPSWRRCADRAGAAPVL